MQVSSSSSTVILPVSNEVEQQIASLTINDSERLVRQLSANERLQLLINASIESLQPDPRIENSIVPTVSTCPDLLQKAARYTLPILKANCKKFIAKQFFSEVKLDYDNDCFQLILSDAEINDNQRQFRDIALRQLCRVLAGKQEINIVIEKQLDDSELVHLFKILSPLLPHLRSLKMHSKKSCFSFNTLLPYLNRSEQLTRLSLYDYPQFDTEQVVAQACSMRTLRNLECMNVSICLPALTKQYLEIDLNNGDISEGALRPIFVQFPRINGIYLKGCASVEALRKVLDAAVDKTKIWQFQLCRYSVDPVAAFRLIDEQLPQLTKLFVRGAVSNNLMTHVLSGFKNVIDLAVGTLSTDDESVQDPITDEFFVQIQKMHPGLSHLSLARLSKITITGVDLFIRQHQSLQNLRIAGCPNISNEQLDKIKR